MTIDESSYSARVRSQVLDLTYKEFELLKFLAQHPGRVFSRGQLLQEVWGYDYFGGTRTVDVHVRRLRAKLGPDHEALIGTVRNVGYKAVRPARGRNAESDDDLEYTLDNWLTQQKRGVTQRKKNGVAHAAVNLDDDLAIEDSMEGYSTVQKYDRMYESQAKELGDEVLDEGNDFYMSETFLENSKEDEGRDVRGGQGVAQADGDVVRGKYMGNDVEVVGLQCMLAQALMGDGEEED